MTLIEVHKKLLSLNIPLIQTQDVAASLKTNIIHASKLLERLEKVGAVKRITRGKWMFSSLKDPLLLPEFLTMPYPSYISLQTALYYHGMISQIPATTYAISLARTCQYKTPLGFVSIHHINIDFFFGFDTYQNTYIKIASPEKALLDTFYLKGTRSLLFKKLPELELPKNFNFKLAKKMIERISNVRLKSMLYKGLQSISP